MNSNSENLFKDQNVAHDVKSEAQTSLEELNQTPDTTVFTGGYDLEPELKFSIPNLHNIRAILPNCLGTHTPSLDIRRNLL